MSGWIDHEILLACGLVPVDGVGRRIDRVRAVAEVEGGIRVRILGTIDDGRPAVLDSTPAAVEFEAFVAGGRLERRA